MRIDKYLKNSRLIKRRTVAKQACDVGRVEVNGRVVKAGYEVSVGDEIAIQFGDKKVRVKVLQLLEDGKKESATEMYAFLE